MTTRVLKTRALKTCYGRTKIVVIASAAAAAFATTPLLAAGSLPQTDSQVAQKMAAHSPHGSCAVIAKVPGDLSPAQQAKLAGLGADITRHLGFIHSVALTLPTQNLRKLAALPFITHLSYDGAVKKSDAFTVASSGAGAAFQQYGLTGKGVGVAVVDSGIRGCDDLNVAAADPQTGSPCQGGYGYQGGYGGGYTGQSGHRYGVQIPSRIQAQLSFVPDGLGPGDYCGHGTHVSGIISGDGQDSTGRQYTQTFYGIARQANIIDARVLDTTGAGSVSTVLAGLQWVVANKSAYNIRVINLSLGHPVSESYTTDPLCQAVEAAWKAGIVVVCAAGNNGRASATNVSTASNEGWGTSYGSIQSPANDPYVITVGATKSMDGVRADDRIATYSSRGPSAIDQILKPDIIAPGNRVISLYAMNSFLYAWNTVTEAGLPMSNYMVYAPSMMSTRYFVLSGTSMACPVVSGAAALMLQKDPTLTPDAVKARLMVSADKWLDPSGNPDPYTYGAGYLDIPAALASTVTPTQSALSPQLTLSKTGLVSTSGIGTTNIWGSKALSGVSTIYGSKALSGVSTVYSSKALSGVNTIFSSASVAASKALCGSSFDANVDLSNVVLNGE